MDDIATIEAKYQALSSRLDEAAMRIWAATEARSLGRGGVSLLAKATGVSRTTIHAGLAELKAPVPVVAVKKDGHVRIRASGGGRKKLTSREADLMRNLDALVEPAARGDPMLPLRWTCKSTRRLAEELHR
jgi:homoserine acetyltransferase